LWKTLYQPARLDNAFARIADPVLPATDYKLVPFGVLANQIAPLEPWELWMNSCGFLESCPVRPFIKDLFSGPVVQKLSVVFDAFSQWDVPAIQSNTLTLQQLLHFSRSIKGTMHALLCKSRKIPIRRPPELEFQWIRDHFSILFTTAHPLDQSTFRKWAEMIIVRRVVITLLEHLGRRNWMTRIAALRRGLSVNVVIELVIEDPRDPEQLLMRVRTVAPRTVPTALTALQEGESGESDEEEHNSAT